MEDATEVARGMGAWGRDGLVERVSLRYTIFESLEEFYTQQ